MPSDAGDALFREVTLRICGDLDLAAALRRAFEVLATAIPASVASLHVYERDLGAVRTVATVPPEEGAGAERFPVAALSGGARLALDATARERVSIVNRLAGDQVSAELAARHGDGPVSLLILRLALSGERLGALVLRADGADRFSPAHAEVLRELHEPFALALSNAMRLGELERLRERLADDNRDLQRQLRRQAGDEVVGADFGLREVMQLVRRVAPTGAPVLLLGETGTGKEVVAEVIHRLSARSRGPLVRVNCGALPGTLVDSELFGHERGAFTGATSQQRGRFERAQGGTIFLDEIGELPPEAQVRLLRVLQDGDYERVGGAQALKADVRVIAATHRDLEAMVAEGSFRADLRFRLSVFPIRIPALRERKGDLPALAHHFLERKARELALGGRPTLAPGAIDQLAAYGWPGNVRELSNVIERALLLSQGRPLAFPDLGARTAPPPTPAGAPQPLDTLEAVTAGHLRAALARTGGRIEGAGGAAALLGLNPSTLRHLLRRLGMPFGRAVGPGPAGR